MSSISYPATELSSATSAATRGAILIYGIATYIFFLAVFTYTIGFVGGFIVPKHIENGVPTGTASAIAIDVVLLALFAIQHSVMARPAFKRWWTRIVPEAAERSTYVLASSLVLVALFVHWEPIGGVVWSVPVGTPRTSVIGLYVFGWLL